MIRYFELIITYRIVYFAQKDNKNYSQKSLIEEFNNFRQKINS